MNINTKLTISRPSNADGSEYVTIQIQDCASRERFVEVRIGLREYAEAITGLSQVPCVSTVRGLDHVGKKKETMSGRIYIPKSVDHNRQAVKEFVTNTAPPEGGWITDNYLGSQNSVVSNGDKTMAEEFPQIANVTYYRYVEVTDVQN